MPAILIQTLSSRLARTVLGSLPTTGRTSLTTAHRRFPHQWYQRPLLPLSSHLSQLYPLLPSQFPSLPMVPAADPLTTSAREVPSATAVLTGAGAARPPNTATPFPKTPPARHPRGFLSPLAFPTYQPTGSAVPRTGKLLIPLRHESR